MRQFICPFTWLEVESRVTLELFNFVFSWNIQMDL